MDRRNNLEKNKIETVKMKETERTTEKEQKGRQIQMVQEKIPLNERIRRIRRQRSDFLGVFSLLTADYCTGLEALNNEFYYWDLYDDTICELEYEMEGGKQLSMSQFIVLLNKLPKEEKGKMLYMLLVEPFTEIKEF